MSITGAAPVFVPNAFDDLSGLVDPNELAGAACESDIESRLVLGSDALDDWSSESGPFDEDRFDSLGPKAGRCWFNRLKPGARRPAFSMRFVRFQHGHSMMSWLAMPQRVVVLDLTSIITMCSSYKSKASGCGVPANVRRGHASG